MYIKQINKEKITPEKKKTGWGNSLEAQLVP